MESNINDHITPIQQFFDMYADYYVIHKKPRNVTKCGLKLLEEAGEAAEAISAFTGNQKKTDKLLLEGTTPTDRLAEELGDVIIVALNIATAAKLDLEDLLLAAVDKMKQRTDKRIARNAENRN